ncbi:dynamin family protein [Thiorhodococcus mannitoliphagus]|uniref:Dynamin family protein n=1 Tax=Thiorhodococcus mannitoliphagus TaxID=329406 RepID=A0A6P1DRD0_9GAMM|nr:dynamin family protein [Thiorhodococcus mannitoliphagus]NEX20608.1 dynamin family protein [Thiorhodococcus mannitoliphagus]
MTSTADALQQRLKDLESHLEQENPVLLSAVQSFRAVDRVAYRMALLEPNQSFATQIPWWPLISVLGTFSAGKSTFINHYLGSKLQRTGNQAVDDRFTVIVYSPEEMSRTLPGVSLDSDPRFPFFRMSQDIEEVAQGEGSRIDAYLQLKTCKSELLRGKIVIDSPGFDADAQRTAVLRITDHMIGLSDLVLVFFDARHPEPGAMRDTLKHLVSDTIKRSDSGKFLYILNQLDTAAAEDNPEDVVAAWVRAMGEAGLTAGRFFTIYCPAVSTQIADEQRRQRFEKKRDEDLGEIYRRMEQVEVERAYRIIAALRKCATDFHRTTIPLLEGALQRWRRRTLIAETLIFSAVAIGILAGSFQLGQWEGLSYHAAWLDVVKSISWGLHSLGGLVILLVLAIHFGVRKVAALSVMPWLRKQVDKAEPAGNVLSCFKQNTGVWRTVLLGRPFGWNGQARAEIDEVLQGCETYIQTLNERFTNPRGISNGILQPANRTSSADTQDTQVPKTDLASETS